MKQTFYMLKNKSKSEGTYFIDNDYKVIYPGETITLTKAPVNHTVNVSITMYQKDINNDFQYKKPQVKPEKPVEKKKD